MRYCDQCGTSPATGKRHSGGFRMCRDCEVRYEVVNGTFVPRDHPSFDAFLASCVNDVVNG